MIRTLCAIALTAAAGLALAVAEMLTRPRRVERDGVYSPPMPVEVPDLPKQRLVPRPRASLIVPVRGTVALDVAAYRFVRGGDA